mmetsp:Transcript_38923/g.105403  ORF Transcript_38923/g.105403 Transcript_38923/m.105403 type:complete len:387 (-) Transcript_38923:93-1253(-)
MGAPRVRSVAPRRSRRGTVGASLLSLACCATALLLPKQVARGWLGPADRPTVAKDTEEAGVAGRLGRRELWRESAAAAAAALWAAHPEDAEAFRNDRILNAKTSYVPTIRGFYQKLEGLRDDLYLDVELETGNADSRVRYAARPADWYSGLDKNLDGPLILASDESGYGCKEFQEKIDGVALIPRGRCTFSEKIKNARQAGAKAVIIYDEKMSKQPLELQQKSGMVRSKGIATRQAGDALYGGVAILPVEKGKTIIGYDKGEKGEPQPELDAAMIGLKNGTTLVDAIKEGKKPRVLDVKRFTFGEGIDDFIKRDLKKMLNEMEIFGLTMRVSKDDMQDAILKTLKKDRTDFANAVRAKDYAAIRQTFASWNSHLDKLGQWDLYELF